jgi:dihydrofolate reductase
VRSLTYLAAVSVDGYIADPDGRFDGFPSRPDTLAAIFTEYPETCPVSLRDAFDVTGPARHFDTVVMGANTHLPALEAGLTSAYPHLDQYVVTHRRDLPPDPTVTFVHDDPVGLIRDLKNEPGLGIWLCGGAHLAGQLADEIDAFHLKINPILLGQGIPLVGRRLDPTDLVLESVRALPGGVQLHVYARR